MSHAAHIRNFYFWEKKPEIRTHQTVLITGAGSGIGLNVAQVYARRLCRLVLVDLNAQALKTAAELCSSLGAEDILTITVDVTNFEQCLEMHKKTIEKFNKIDVMVLCAGIGAHHLFSHTNDLTIFHRLMSVNFYGYLHCVKACYESLCASNGLLIAITSFSGEVGLPYRTAYCASKFAVTGFLEALRSEMATLEETKGNKTFHITICCPPTVNTNLRKNALTPDPTLKEAPSKNALSVEECAAAIVDAGDRRLRKAFFPFNSWLASYLRPLIPDVMDKLIMKRAKL